MNYMFCSCESITSLNVSNFNTQNVRDMTYMFAKCISLTSLDVLILLLKIRKYARVFYK